MRWLAFKFSNCLMFTRSIQSLRRRLLDRMVLRPTRGPVDSGGQSRVILDVAGGKLEFFVARNFDDGDAAELLVLKFPGTAGRAERSTLFPVSALDNVRGEVWTWNPPGYGGSTGRATLAEIAAATEPFLKAALQLDNARPCPVWLCGNSLGCNTALHAATLLASASVPVGLILRNPPPLIAVVKRIASRYPMGHRIAAIAESLCDPMNAMVTAPRVSFPAVFIQSQDDDLVPPPMQNEVIAAYAGDRKVVELVGVTHDGIANDDQQLMIVQSVQWLWKRTQP